MTIPCDFQLLDIFKTRQQVAGSDSGGGFAYQLDFSTPAIATAIHAGHDVRNELIPYIGISSDQRKFEEDTGTDIMIQGVPNAVWGLESRAVYDLNRHPDMALPLEPEKFWGVRVYDRQPAPEMNQRSLYSYDAFYRFFGTVVTHMLERFGYCIVYDIHSYNITRQIDKGFASPPIFNLGTAALERDKWKQPIQSWLDELGRIILPGIETTVAENLVFQGKGEFCKQVTQWDSRVLVLPTEISKVYMDELSGTIYPDVIQAVKTGLTRAVSNHVSYFNQMK